MVIPATLKIYILSCDFYHTGIPYAVKTRAFFVEK